MVKVADNGFGSERLEDLRTALVLPKSEWSYLLGVNKSSYMRWVGSNGNTIKVGSAIMLCLLAERALARGAAPAAVRRLAGLGTADDGRTVRIAQRDNVDRLRVWSYLAQHAFDEDEIRQMGLPGVRQ